MREDCKHRAFLSSQHGFTGAERALLLCFGLAILSLVGHLISQGSMTAASEARRALITQNGSGHLQLVSAVLPSAAPIPAGSPQRTLDPSQGRPPIPAASAPASPGGTYTVQPGDTLSTIAARELGDSSRWQEIYDLNRQIIGNDPSLIQVGMQLQLPGGGPAPPPPGPANNAAQVAQSFLGDTEYNLQPSGALDMDGWVPQSEDCANFVSGCLEKAGLISHDQRSDAVVQLAANLRAAGWKDIPLADAQPGDVVCFDGPDGPYQHVELFNGWVDGQPQYIGSNNILPDGTQEISYDNGQWAYQVHVLSPP